MRRPFKFPKLGVAPPLIALLLVLGLVGAMAIEPTRHLLEQRKRISGMANDLSKIERINVRLERQITRLKDPDYVEKKAREVGLVRPGEIPFVVMPPSRAHVRAEKARAARKDRPSKKEDPGFVEGLLDFIGLG